MNEVLGQGAEAVLTRVDGTVQKHRVAKSYRLAEIDVKMRRQRQRREEKVIGLLRSDGVLAPAVLKSDEVSMTLTLAFVDGPKVRDVMDKEPVHYGAAVGGLLARMHSMGIAHGDPTTSNFIAAKDGVHVIDFGLSFFSKKVEDFAVDLHLLRQVLEGTHTLVFQTAWKAAREGYVAAWPEGKAVVDWLDEKVEKRGRNKKR